MEEHRKSQSTRRDSSDRRGAHRRSEHRRKQNYLLMLKNVRLLISVKDTKEKGNRRSGLDRREELKKGQ